MLHGSETWPLTKNFETASEQTEIKMVRWLCAAEIKGQSTI